MEDYCMYHLEILTVVLYSKWYIYFFLLLVLFYKQFDGNFFWTFSKFQYKKNRLYTQILFLIPLSLLPEQIVKVSIFLNALDRPNPFNLPNNFNQWTLCSISIYVYATTKHNGMLQILQTNSISEFIFAFFNFLFSKNKSFNRKKCNYACKHTYIHMCNTYVCI